MAIEHIGIKNFAGTEDDVAVDVVGTDKFQAVKIVLGADGAMDNLVDAGTQAAAASIPVALSTEDNAILATIDSSLDTLAGAVTSTHVQVDVLSAPSTAITNADITPLAGAVAGGHMQVDVLSVPSTVVTATHLDTRHLNATDDVMVVNLSATDNAVLDAIALAVAGEAGAVTSGVLMQGDDGTDRTNVLVDVAGHLQVDVLTTPSTAVTNADMTTVAGAVSGGHMQVDVLTTPAIRALTNADVVTAELSATDNAVLDAIDTAIDIIAGAVSSTHMQVDVLTTPAVRALTNADVITAELSATDNAVLDSLDTKLGTIDTAIDAINTKLATGTVIGDVNLGATDNAILDDIAAKVAGAYGKTRLGIRVAIVAATTATVWDPTAGKKFVLTKIVVSCKTAGDIQFFDNTDTAASLAIGPILTLGIAGGWSESWPLEWPYISAAADNILKYTTGAGFTGSVYVEGYEL
jgi:hypothetical protein